MVLQVSKESDLNQIKLGTKEDDFLPYVIKHHKKMAYIHYRIPLKTGKNTFYLTPGQEKFTLRYKPLRTLLNVNFDSPSVYLYHREEIMKNECRPCHDVKTLPKDKVIKASPYGKLSPACYSCHKAIFQETRWQHSPAANLMCETCHEKRDDVGLISVTIGKDATLCYQCHLVKGRVWGEMAHIHGPVGLGVCAVCHNPHGDAYRFQLWADGKGEICISCHTDKQVLYDESTSVNVHGIIIGGGCTSCHNPHASEERFLLSKPINELCISCHNTFEGIKTGHPVGGHPVSGDRDPRRKDRKFVCTSCHNPHGSKFKYLLIGDILGGHVCSKCHK
jgi:predicted CXXCH cytochrome family protein